MTSILLIPIRLIDPGIDNDQPVPAAGDDDGMLDLCDILALCGFIDRFDLRTLVRAGGAL
ncbi:MULTISPECIES: hypothetical protein [Rhizobium/Agrobacterium group]|uniref:hypothetical protein n=1 Tax=Rhizobium/Agrobacterium group TaxID=227290 RepID=UPI000B3FE644|nr:MULTISPECIES: hypothetical protein [Rhizobium/Agrobacterium group]NSZ41580.1 hypothetical protein [Agrobacterium vitis]NTA25263.1 hypothetical protein [Allorhizobium ampelinum]OVE98098.1 hypothetical protein B7W85_01945 [Allorhizobium ampelinum]